ncbi:MAG: CAP domain-containing protein [Longimicrobiaceae bacterium]
MTVYRPAGATPSGDAARPMEAGQPCPRPDSAAVAAARVALSTEERELGILLERDPGQRRPRIVFNPILSRVARQRARDMAARDYLGHTDPDGFGANHHVERAGYRLPAFYDHSPAGNNIESIGGGYEVAAIAWRGWMHSPGHRTHLLGLEPFYREQSEYGVGYAWSRDSKYHHYWAVLIARPGC